MKRLRRTGPLPWFLPGPLRIRGGLARKFSSDLDFHRGIHLEATCDRTSDKAFKYQILAQQPRVPKVDFSILVKNPPKSVLAEEESSGKPPENLPPKKCDSDSHLGLTFLAPLTYPLIIEELRPEDKPCGRFCFPNIAIVGASLN